MLHHVQAEYLQAFSGLRLAEITLERELGTTPPGEMPGLTTNSTKPAATPIPRP